MRTIKRPAVYEPIVRLLAETNHPTTSKSIFPTMRELLCFAAVLGYSLGKRSPLDGSLSEIDGRIFENSQQAIDLIYLISLVEAGTADILHPDQEDAMLSIFEEYAAAGLGVIDSWLKERPDDIYGNQALLAAFRRYGFIPASRTSGPVKAEDVSF